MLRIKLQRVLYSVTLAYTNGLPYVTETITIFLTFDFLLSNKSPMLRQLLRESEELTASLPQLG